MIDFLQRYKVLLQNFSYLTILKALTLVLPLITFPYLMRVLGAEKYGLVMWAWAIAEMFIVFIKFGLDTLGVKLVSENRENLKKLSYIVSKLTYIKVFLLLISSVVFFVLLFTIESIARNQVLFLCFYVFIVFESMLPVWYFQGIENMRVMAILVASIKLVFALLVFLFIDEQSDYLIVPILYAIGSIFSFLLAYFLILNKDKVKFCKVQVRETYGVIKESSYILFSNLSVVARDRLTIILIKMYLGLDVVAYFDISIKIINVLLTPFHMVSQVLYPHIAKTKDMLLLKKIMLFIMVLALIVVGVFIYNIDWISVKVNEQHSIHLRNIMSLLIFIVPIGAISGLIGASVLIVFQQTKWLLIATLSAIVSYFAMFFIVSEYTVVVFAYIYLLAFSVELAVKFYRINKLKLFKYNMIE